MDELTSHDVQHCHSHPTETSRQYGMNTWKESLPTTVKKKLVKLTEGGNLQV